jgi:hypothetical protein
MIRIFMYSILSLVGVLTCIGENIALNKSYTLEPKPNYPLTRKGNTDLVDLTDGKLVKGCKLWYYKDAVGWSWKYNKAKILLDLGKEYPIQQVRLHLQGGSEQYSISFPENIQLLASDDKKQFFPIEEFNRSKDRSNYKIPLTKGKSWTHWLTFKEKNFKCRYLLFVVKNGGQLILCDEIEVIRGKNGTNLNNRLVKSVPIRELEFYFPKQNFTACRNLPLPGYFSCLDTRKDATGKINFEMITPPGVIVEAGRFGQKVLYSKRSFVKKENPAFKRLINSHGNNILTFSSKTRTKKSWSRFFLQFKSDYIPKVSDKISIIAKWDDKVSRTDVPLKTFKAPELKTVSSKIFSGINFGRNDVELWPDVLKSFKRLGFNIFYAFGNATTIRGSQLDLINEARKNGFIIAYVDSPFFKLHSLRWKKSKEFLCQLPQNKYSDSLCPSYRGKYYEAELNRIAKNCKLCQPAAIFFDIELWGSGGPIKHGSKKCVRCQEAKQKNNCKTWDDLFEYMGFQMMQDIRNKIEKTSKNVEFQMGSYEMGPLYQKGFYQHSWRFNKLYPQILQFAQPCYYSSLMDSNLEELNKKLSKIRSKLSSNAMVPWLTPGDFGEFTSNRLEDALNICFINGSIGINWWSSRCWEPEDVVQVAKFFSGLAGMEDIVKNGVKSNMLSTKNKTQQLHSLKYKKTMLLCAWDYTSKLPAKIFVNSKQKIRSVTELQTGKKIPVNNDQKSFTLTLDSKRNILYKIEL